MSIQPPGTAQSGNLGALAAGANNGVANYTGVAVGSAGMVYMGVTTDPSPEVYKGMTDREAAARKVARGTAGQPINRPIQEAVNEFYKWSPSEFAVFLKEATTLGHDTRGWTTFSPTALALWTQTVNTAAAYGAVNAAEPLTPWEVLRKTAEAANGTGARSTSVVNLTNAADAKTLVNNSLGEYLGRAATQDELDSFITTLNNVERKNPVNSSQTQRSGGTNPQMVAEEFAQSRPDAAEFTAQSQYANWLMEKVSQDPTAGVASGL